MDDFDSFLRNESLQFNQEKEVERVLKLMEEGNKDPFLVLEVPTDVYITLECNLPAAKKAFRQKSLLVHPDKNQHPMARKVFDELNRALKQISGEGEEDLERVFNYIRDARDYIFHLKGLAIPKKQPTEQDRLMLLSLTRTEQPSMGRLIQLEFTRAVRELHYRDRTRLLNEQGRELQESEIVATEGKRVRKLQKEWEDGREDRIGKWRVFAEKGVKKKKKKEPLLGAIRK